MRTVTTASLLLSLVCVSSASASYFFNSEWGTMLNVGSAPNPTPLQLRAIGDSRIAPAPEDYQSRGAAAVAPATVSVVPTTASAERTMMASVVTPTDVAARRLSPKAEKRITAELNKASLMRATASLKGKPPVKTAVATTAAKKQRI
jgi:hypothetical protein